MRTLRPLLILPLAVFTSPVAAQKPVPLVTGKFISPAGAHTEVGSFPANMLLTPDGRHVVVSNTGFYQYLSVLRATDGKLISRIEVGKPDDDKKEGLYYGMAFGVSGGAILGTVRPDDTFHTLYVSRGAEDKVAIYHISSDGVLADTGKRLNNPGAIGERKDANIVAGIATNRGSGMVYAVNNNTTAETGLKGSLSILDPVKNSLIRKVDVGGFPFAVAALTLGPDADKKVYVSSERDGVVSVVDPAQGKVTATIRTGQNALAMLLDRAQKRLFVANAGSDTVSVVDTSTDRVTQTIPLRPDDVRGLPGATPQTVGASAS